jgi:hypothetical protein
VLFSNGPRKWLPRLLQIVVAAGCGFGVLYAHAAADAPAVAVEASNPYATLRTAGVEISVRDSGWDGARAQDIETVLYSVATILLEHFPGRRLNPIVVSHSAERPMTLYKKGAGNSYQVQLSAKGEHWARYAYEFAHEFSHILMNYDHQANARTATFNQWFEEALCEAASLYALKRLAFVWEHWPPQPQWAAYSIEFERYVERFQSESHRRLTDDVSLAEWFQKHEEALRTTAYLRSYNEVVATVLLPLFEDNEAFWEAIGYLNLEPKRSTFREYLETWHDNAPDEYKDTIRYIMGLFGVLREADTASSATSGRVDTPPRAPLQRRPAGVAGPAPREVN